MEELLPCPFCGAKPNFERIGTPRVSCIVACGNCGCMIESSDEGEESGNFWNTRSHQQPAHSEDARDAARYRWLMSGHTPEVLAEAMAKGEQPVLVKQTEVINVLASWYFDKCQADQMIDDAMQEEGV